MRKITGPDEMITKLPNKIYDEGKFPKDVYVSVCCNVKETKGMKFTGRLV